MTRDNVPPVPGPVLYELADGVATIALDEPDTRNALSDELLDALIAAFEAARDDDDVRCVVLTSTHDKVFSSGGNLAGFAAEAPLVHKHFGTARFPRLFRLIGELGKPTICAANGHVSSLSNAQEPEVFADLQSGRSAFSLNWPYVLSSMREANPELVPDLGYTTYPTISAGEAPGTTLGGMNYAVSSYSRHPDEAFDAAMCMRSPENQLKHAQDAGNPPTNRSVYDRPEFQEAYPMYEELLVQLGNAVPRPISPVYQNISTVLSSTLSPPAAIDPQASADQLRTAIQNAIEGKGILP